MGYTTTFKGRLDFIPELTASQLSKVKSFFGEDCRDHPEWDCDGTYIDLRLTEDFKGMEWDDETEKNYGMVDHVTMIIREMRKVVPDFTLTGTLVAQGEDPDDRWSLIVTEDGEAEKRDIIVQGTKVKCPHCGEEFRVNFESAD